MGMGREQRGGTNGKPAKHAHSGETGRGEAAFNGISPPLYLNQHRWLPFPIGNIQAASLIIPPPDIRQAVL